MSALNPFLVHRSFGLPPLSWDLRIAARAILFPGSGPGAPAIPMATSDYTQPATWPPCGALRIGAIGGHAEWRWPCVAGTFPRADREPARVCEVSGARGHASGPRRHRLLCLHRARRSGLPPGWSSSSDTTSAAALPPDGIRRVDCLLGHTHFWGLQPGPGTGEWTMFVGAP
ncbi:hypothetical protein BJV74DRAFT_780517 [Russula compacta]|nr:hypothetical protein BJV74DRAFT_780517 [Russula compacta]